MAVAFLERQLIHVSRPVVFGTSLGFIFVIPPSSWNAYDVLAKGNGLGAETFRSSKASVRSPRGRRNNEAQKGL